MIEPSLIILAIYLSFIYDFVVAPIPSEASTHALVTRPRQVSLYKRIFLSLAHIGLLLLWLYPLLISLLDLLGAGYQRSGILPWCGIFLALLGRGLTVTASLQLQKTGTANVVSSGVFAFSRHPIVVGLHLTLFGLLLSSGNLYCLLLYPLTLLYFDKKVHIEETALLRRLDSHYRDYARVTPRYLIFVGKTSNRKHGN